MHTLETTPEGHDEGLALVDDILPWLEDSKGFRGMLRLATPDRSKTVVLTLWADEASLRASAESARGLGRLAAEATGSKRVGLEDYEVTFFDGELKPTD
jgi:heme-degrading monooxygenase HmoA